MKEEFVTKSIIRWLLDKNWKIVCYDFPQSGTGRILHPNDCGNEKNKNSIIPDIVAVKNEICIFSENKDRFFLSDYKKQNLLRTSDLYSKAIAYLLKDYKINNIYYGIGLPSNKHKLGSIGSVHYVDFILGVNEDSSINIIHNEKDIAFL